MQIIFGILGLGLVVFIHEGGHFLAARAVGIQVEVFSLGWGRKLVGFIRGGTEYRISMIPLGGFVKMKGETEYQKAVEDGLDAIEPEEGSFFNAAPWKRIIVAIAGPLMNLLFALLVITIIQLAGFSYGSFSNKIILADDFPQYLGMDIDKSPAFQAGLQSGDEILSVDGVQTGNFYKIQQQVSTRALETVELELKRDGLTITTEAELLLNPDSGAGILGIYPWIEPVIASPIENSAGLLEPGDLIVSVNGHNIANSYDLRAVLDEIPDSRDQIRVELEVLRNQELISITHPLIWEETSKMLLLGYRYQQDSYVEAASGLPDALARGWREISETLEMTVKGLGLLFKGLDPLSAFSGPIKITMMVGEVTAQGLAQGFATGVRAFFHLLSLLSVALFFGNLLPIPVLDGGQILVFTAEIIRRKPIKPKTFFRYQTVGAIVVFALIIFVLFGDLIFVFTQ